MKKESRFPLLTSLLCFALFILLTASLFVLDVQAVGPEQSKVGFSHINAAFHRLTGVHMNIYTLTDWLSLILVFVVLFFIALGLVQLIRRRNILKVDADLLLLGAFYLVVVGAYLLFEEFPVNYRPVLIAGVLEASYPSSTTLLVLTVMPTAIMQAHRRIRNASVRKASIGIMAAFAALMVLGRLISGVHWLTDIVGGILLSAALVQLYAFSIASLTASSK